MMNNAEFEFVAKALVVDRYNLVNSYDKIGIDDISTIWLAHILKNNRAVLVLNSDSDQNIYEVTYCGDKDELHMNIYAKTVNVRSDGSIVETLKEKYVYEY